MIVLPIAAAVVVVVGVAAATRSRRFEVVRSIAIDAPSDRIAPLIDDLRRWPDWQPDDAARTFSGAKRGVGAVCDVDGKQMVARMEVVEASPTTIRVRAVWRRPFVATNENVFRLAPRDGGGTDVSWTLDGERVAILKLMTVFVPVDRIMGLHLERGLAALAQSVLSQR